MDAVRVIDKKDSLNEFPFVKLILLAALFVANGLGNAYLNTISIILLFLYTILPRRNSDALLLVPFASIFLGYSDLTFSLIGGISLEISTIQNLFYFVLFGKIIISNYRFSIELDSETISFILLIAYAFVIELFTIKITQSVWLISRGITVYILIKCIDSDDARFVTNYIYAYSIALIAEFLYGFLFTYGRSGYSWRGFQFNGVSDPNNFAIDCIFAFYLVMIRFNELVSSLYRKLIAIISSIGVLLSLSFSGLCVWLVFVGLYLAKRYKKIVVVFFFVIIAFLFILLLLVDLDEMLSEMSSSNIMVVSKMGERLTSMLAEFRLGDMAGFTTGRTTLWERYYYYYKKMPVVSQFFGNKTTLSKLTNEDHASHNTYLDILIGYGLIGSVLLLFFEVIQVYKLVKEHQYYRLVFKFMFLILLFTRSTNLITFIFYTSL